MNCPRCNAGIEKADAFCQHCGEVLPSSDPMIDRVLLEKYKITKKLGEGGFGAVYEAYHLRLDSKVAIKTLHAGISSRKQVVERFRREALATSRIQNPNAVKVFDRGATEDGVFWIAMEFIDGVPLDAYLASHGPLSERELIEIFGPICEVLSEAHEKGIIHRDLKPQNVMLIKAAGGNLIPKVLDFGIASLKEAGTDGSLTGTGAVSGTPKYMAPEQWEGLKKTDARSDVYSLAMMAYQCVTGRLPYEADTPLAWMKQHNFGVPLPLEQAATQSLSPSLQEAIMRGISKDPAARPQSALAFKQALSGEQPLLARTPQPTAVSDLYDTLGNTLPSVENKTPSQEATTPKKSSFWLPGLVSLGLLLLGVVAYSIWPKTTQIAPTSKKTSLPASVPFSIATSVPLVVPPSLPAATQSSQPATKPSEPDPKEKEAMSALSACKKAFAAREIEEAFAACKKIPRDTQVYKEASREIAEVNSQYNKQKLWNKIKTSDQKGESLTACTALKEYLKRSDLTQDERRQAALLEEKYSDSQRFPECNP